ncbi:MAG: phenylacetate--CoA ligase family protein [Betaproteobacteria bacterium]|nr:phenylacetate--CoA ligase family protein [Betaproteobacteria bacterium]
MIDWRMSYSDLRAAQQPALARQLSRVWDRSEFYREIWKKPPSESSFGELPLVTKQDFHEALQSGFLGSNLSCAPEDLVHIHTSSGTSGRPTYFGLTARDYAAWMKIFTRGFQLAGIRPGDRVLQGFAMSRGYAGGVPMIEAFESMGCVALPVGAEAGSVRLVDAIRQLLPNVLYASPSMARRLAGVYRDEVGRSAADSSVRLLLTGGEPGAGDPESKRALGDMWGAEVRECGGGTDVSPLMVVECEAHDGLHFVAGDEVLIEVINPIDSSLASLTGRAEGEIVYTHLAREANPVVRMRHGDLVELSTEPCRCGMHAPRLWFRGRSDDMLIVKGVKIFPSNIQAVVSEFAPDLSGAFTIRRPNLDDAAGLLRVVCESVRVADPDLKGNFERRARDRIGVRIECELVPLGTLGADQAQKGKWLTDD